MTPFQRSSNLLDLPWPSLDQPWSIRSRLPVGAHGFALGFPSCKGGRKMVNGVQAKKLDLTAANMAIPRDPWNPRNWIARLHNASAQCMTILHGNSWRIFRFLNRSKSCHCYSKVFTSEFAPHFGDSITNEAGYETYDDLFYKKTSI